MLKPVDTSGTITLTVLVNTERFLFHSWCCFLFAFSCFSGWSQSCYFPPPVTGLSGGERTPGCHHLSLNSCICEECPPTTVSQPYVWRHRHRIGLDGKEQKWHGPSSANLSHRCRLWRGKVLAQDFLSLVCVHWSVPNNPVVSSLWHAIVDVMHKNSYFFHVRWTLKKSALCCEVAAVISIYFFHEGWKSEHNLLGHREQCVLPQ